MVFEERVFFEDEGFLKTSGLRSSGSDERRTPLSTIFGARRSKMSSPFSFFEAEDRRIPPHLRYSTPKIEEHIPPLLFFVHGVRRSLLYPRSSKSRFARRALSAPWWASYVMLCHVHRVCPIKSCHVMSNHIKSHHVTSRQIKSNHVTSRHVTSNHAKSSHVMSNKITSSQGKSRQVMSCHVKSCQDKSSKIKSSKLKRYHAMSCHVISCRVI